MVKEENYMVEAALEHGFQMSENGKEFKCTQEQLISLVSSLKPIKNLNAKAILRAKIKEVFLAKGFTVKEGEKDLKDYVYDAAETLLSLVVFYDTSRINHLQSALRKGKTLFTSENKFGIVDSRNMNPERFNTLREAIDASVKEENAKA